MSIKNISAFLFATMLVFFMAACSPKTTSISMDKKETMQKNFRAQAPSAGPAPKVSMGEYTSFTIDNGLKVVVVENHKLPKVSFSLQLDEDPSLEKGKAGLASFTGDLLSKGTMKKSKSKLDEEIDYIGARLNTGSSGIYGSSLTKHTETLVNLMTEILMYPSFAKNEFDKLKAQNLSALQSSKTNSDAISSNVSRAINYSKNHPYGELTTEETIENIQMEDVVNYYKTYWKPNVSYLAIVGDITPERAREIVNEHFSSWSKGEVPSHSYDQPTVSEKATVHFVDKPGAVQSTIRVTYPVDLKPNDPDRYAASVMNSILGGGAFSGYLMQNLREDKAFTYGARSSLNYDKLVGTFSANTSVRNEVTDSAITEIIYEMNRIRTEPVDADQLQLIKNSITGSFARAMESGQTLAGRVVNLAKYNLPKDFYENYLTNINAVTKEDVMRVAQRFIRPDNANIIVVGNKDDVAEKLAKFSTGGVNFYDIYANPIEEIKMPMADGRTAKTIVMNYLDAIGGVKALKGIKTMSRSMNASIQGQSMTTTTYYSNGNFRRTMNMGAMVLQDELVKDGNVTVKSQGQVAPLSDEDKMAIIEESVPFRDYMYLEAPYTLELKGMEKIEDENAYRVVVKKEDGSATTMYFGEKSALKLREITSQTQGDQTRTVTVDFSDYRDVDGFKVPFKSVITGAMPIPLSFETNEVKINQTIENTIFD